MYYVLTDLNLVSNQLKPAEPEGGGGGEGHSPQGLTPSDFGRSVNPILTRVADDVHHITKGQ